MASKKIEKKVHYRLLFVAYNGPGPWPCGECGGRVYLTKKFDVDHIDGNHQNDAPSNLQALHPSCHDEKTTRDRANRILQSGQELTSATKFLRQWLHDHGPTLVRDIVLAGQQAGFSYDQIRRAKNVNLREVVRAKRADIHDRCSPWMWELIELPTVAPRPAVEFD